MSTQENDVIRKDKQTSVIIDEQEVWIDHNMVELIVALNNAGLKTRSHCGGHDTNPKWVVVRSDNITDIQIRSNGEYKEIVLTWTD